MPRARHCIVFRVRLDAVRTEGDGEWPWVKRKDVEEVTVREAFSFIEGERREVKVWRRFWAWVREVPFASKPLMQ